MGRILKLRDRQRARLKDVIIDYVYYYCFDQKVLRIRTHSGDVFSYDTRELAKNDPLLEHFKGNVKRIGSETRNSEYCKILLGEPKVHEALTRRLLTLGFKKSKSLYKELEESIDYLVAGSYLVRDFDEPQKVKLSEKGLKHYKDGNSFEKSHVGSSNTNKALIISLCSIAIALLTLMLKLSDVKHKVNNSFNSIEDSIKKPKPESIQETGPMNDIVPSKSKESFD